MAYDDSSIVGFLTQTHQTSLLTEREKHLVGLAVTMTRGCQVCTRNRIEKARAAGIGDDLLNALVGVVSAVNAGVTAATAREGFRLGRPPPHRKRRAPTSARPSPPAMTLITARRPADGSIALRRPGGHAAKVTADHGRRLRSPRKPGFEQERRDPRNGVHISCGVG